jgi:Xaa-Pro aminopeptidase
VTSAAAGIELAPVDLPRYELPAEPPTIPAATYQARLAAATAAATAAGLDALIVYADREHFANLSYLTGYDPRFEESLLIMTPGRAPVLLVGNEGEAYAKVVPDGVQVVRYQSFSLVSQDRSASPRLDAVLRSAGLGSAGLGSAGLRSAGLGSAGLGEGAQKTGIAGWKYFGPAEADHPDQWIDAPAFIVDQLRALGCQPVNATGLFTAPGRGLRLVNDADQLACFEFAASHGSDSMRRMLHRVRPGLTEIAAFSLFEPTGLPYSYHPTMLSGERAALGVASPSGRVLRRGDPMSASLGYWGSNIARGGFLAASESDLPASASDYLERLVAPYYACAAEWYETIGIGVTGGELFEVARRHLADPFFGVHLNPGHFIHLDEWPSSPVYAGSDVALTSGMALQLDIIPATGTAYHTSNIEDGVALAGDALRAELAARYPGLWQRVTQRRAFMADAFGIRLKPEVLPLSNLAGYLPPLWLSPQLAMRRK